VFKTSSDEEMAGGTTNQLRAIPNQREYRKTDLPRDNRLASKELSDRTSRLSLFHRKH